MTVFLMFKFGLNKNVVAIRNSFQEIAFYHLDRVYRLSVLFHNFRDHPASLFACNNYTFNFFLPFMKVLSKYTVMQLMSNGLISRTAAGNRG